MAEQLGEALLVLRTDDSQLDRGIGAAEGKAKALGATFDRTKASTAGFSKELGVASKEAVAASGSFQRVSSTVTASAGAQKAGLNQLTMQIGDMSTMYALGARPSQIFASQIGQVTQAVQLMTGGTSKLASFLGGPWGIAIMVAVQVLGPFIGKLWESEAAMKAVTLASNGMQDAQGALGEIFDLTTGKIKNQNEMLRLNAQLLAINLRADALAKRTSSDDALGNFSSGSLGISAKNKVLGALGIPVYGSVGREEKVSDLLRDYRTGKITPIAAAKRAEGLDFTGLAIDKSDFIQAIADGVSAEAKNKTADLIEKSLASNTLDPAFRTPGTPRRRRAGPKGKAQADIDAMQADALSGLEKEELRARLDLATDATERADIQKELLQQDREDRIRKVEADKNLSRAQKDAQIAGINRLIGKPAKVGPDDEIIATGAPGLLAQRINRDAEAQQAQLNNDMLARQRAALDSQASIAANLQDRNRLEGKSLAIQQAIERNLLDQEIANGRVADADQARALLAERQAIQRQQLLNSQKGPLARFRDQLASANDNVNTAIEGIEVDGLQSLNDELADAILGAKSLGEAFGNVADQIIRDLLRIAIQRAVIAPLADALFGASEGGGGVLGSLLRGVGKIFGGGRAIGGPVNAGTAYLVGERGPEIVVPGSSGTVIPNHRLGGGGTAVSVPISIDATGADPAGLARVAAALDQLRAELPGRIVQTVQEAGDRRIISARGWQ